MQVDTISFTICFIYPENSPDNLMDDTDTIGVTCINAS